MESLGFIVYSDYLCPWCFNASVRLRQIEREYGDQVRFEWRSFLLRPEPRRPRDRAAAMEKFRKYTENWLRIGAEADAGAFQRWSTDEGPPSHSVPAHLVAKAAARIDDDAFHRMHDRLLRAYFSENRDISDGVVLQELWSELELPPSRFAERDDPALEREVVRQYREALETGATGVPAVRLADNPAVIVGAQPLDLYRRWVDRTLARRAEEASAGS